MQFTRKLEIGQEQSSTDRKFRQLRPPSAEGGFSPFLKGDSEMNFFCKHGPEPPVRIFEHCRPGSEIFLKIQGDSDE